MAYTLCAPPSATPKPAGCSSPASSPGAAKAPQATPGDDEINWLDNYQAALREAPQEYYMPAYSLTVNEVVDQPGGACDFSLNIIPHTGEVTTLGGLRSGDAVNLEIDVLARYLKRMQSLKG